MAGYIGKSQGVTQVDGYNRAEADAEFVNDPNNVITVSSGNVGIGTSSPSSLLDVDQSQDAETNIELTNTNTGSSAQVRTKYTTDGGLFTVGKTSNAHAFGGDAYLYNVDNTNIRFATSDIERMRIDSAGRVTTPYQPAFHASRNSDVSWGNYDITFATQTLDRGNNFNGTIFTAPVAGVYFFTATLSLAGGTTGQDDTMYWGFLKNGANYQILNDNWSFLLGTGGNGVDMTVSQSALISLSANDNVKVNVSGISHTGGLIQAGSSFSGYLVG